MPESSQPSKQFIILGSIVTVVVIGFLIFQTNWFHNIFHYKKSTITPSTTVADLVVKDSNGNGIPDWEERLWGLDPTVLYTNGESNAQIIKDKQTALGVSGASNNGSTNNETDAIAQQLFSITTALSQNQDIDDATLQNIANKLGSSINIKIVGNTYSLKNLHIISTTTTSLTTYQQNLSKILSQYNLNQGDVTIIINAAQTGDYSAFPSLGPIGITYLALAKQLSSLPVPIGVAQYHLNVMNGYAGMAKSFQYLMQIQDNSSQALVGIALYKTYAGRAQAALYNLDNYLTKYGILSS